MEALQQAAVCNEFSASFHSRRSPGTISGFLWWSCTGTRLDPVNPAKDKPPAAMHGGRRPTSSLKLWQIIILVYTKSKAIFIISFVFFCALSFYFLYYILVFILNPFYLLLILLLIPNILNAMFILVFPSVYSIVIFLISWVRLLILIFVMYKY